MTSARPAPREEPNDEAASRRFVSRLAVSLAAFLAGLGLLNATIDPHGLHRWIDVEGLNHIKPRANQSPEPFKYRAVEVIAPRTLLLGNSRVEMGWNPDDLPSERFGAAVNAAIPGSGLASMVAIADHAWLRSRPEYLLVGLEFFDCLASGPRPAPRAPAVSAWSATQGARDLHLRRTRALLEDALSLDTVTDTIMTVVRQRDPDAPHLRADGFQTARDYPAIVRVDGVRKMFEQRESETIRARMRSPRSIRYADGTPSICFDALERLLEQARDRNQTVLLATYPYHARLLEIIAQTGLLPAYEDWMREITRVAEKARAASTRVSLRDFSGYHVYASEPIETNGAPKRTMQWYWESGHFKAGLGREMLAMMTGAKAAHTDFGQEMTQSSIEAILVRHREGRARFSTEQPDVVAEIRTAIARSK